MGGPASCHRWRVSVNAAMFGCWALAHPSTALPPSRRVLPTLPSNLSADHR